MEERNDVASEEVVSAQEEEWSNNSISFGGFVVMSQWAGEWRTINKQRFIDWFLMLDCCSCKLLWDFSLDHSVTRFKIVIVTYSKLSIYQYSEIYKVWDNYSLSGFPLDCNKGYVIAGVQEWHTGDIFKLVWSCSELWTCWVLGSLVFAYSYTFTLWI